MTHTTRHRPAVAAIAALTILVNPSLPLVAAIAQAQGAAAAKPAAAKPAAAKPAAAKPAGTAAGAAAAAKPVDGGWPRAYALTSGGSILVYQPQISTWQNQRHVVAFSAVSYRATAAEKPALGTVKLEAE